MIAFFEGKKKSDLSVYCSLPQHAFEITEYTASRRFSYGYVTKQNFANQGFSIFHQQFEITEYLTWVNLSGERAF